MRIRRCTAVLFVTAIALGSRTPARSQDSQWKMPEIKLPATIAHPFIACTPAELERLRAAWRGGGAEHDVVAERIERADRALERPVEFPPRGGQHNQWYQCDDCQIALEWLDDTHHRCPKCKKIYSGEPYDDVIFARKHGENLANMESTAWAYAITGERKYADRAAQILRGYAERYAKYPYHSNTLKGKPGPSGGHLNEQTLGEAAMMAGEIAPAFDLIYDALSEADRESIRAGLILPMLENLDKHKTGKGNWQTWHNAAMVTGGAMLGEVEWVRKAIADPANGFVFQMGASVSRDGMWYENSWGYHYYTLSAMVHIVEGARRLGIDLYSHPSMRKMFTAPIEYAMPDGSLPRFGDDVRSSVRSAASYLEYAWNAHPDPAMLPYLGRRPNWTSVMLGRKAGESADAPPLASKVFRDAGHAILRTQGKAGLAAAMTFGPYGGFHGHFDKLSFVLFGRGRELGVDPGRARSQAYRLPIHTNWYKATLGHNAVLVDRAPQKPAAGRLESFAANEKYAAAVASCDEAYPGVKHRRAIVLTPTYALVFDELTAEQEHHFDWVYHNRGSVAECDVAKEGADLAKAFAGGEYIRNAKTGKTGEPIRLRFEDEGVATHVLLDGAPETEVLTGDGPGGSILERVPITMVARSGKTARFAAVIEPVAAGETPLVTSVGHEIAGGGAIITVRRGGETDLIELSPNGALIISAGGREALR